MDKRPRLRTLLLRAAAGSRADGELVAALTVPNVHPVFARNPDDFTKIDS